MYIDGEREGDDVLGVFFGLPQEYDQTHLDSIYTSCSPDRYSRVCPVLSMCLLLCVYVDLIPYIYRTKPTPISQEERTHPYTYISLFAGLTRPKDALFTDIYRTNRTPILQEGRWAYRKGLTPRRATPNWGVRAFADALLVIPKTRSLRIKKNHTNLTGRTYTPIYTYFYIHSCLSTGDGPRQAGSAGVRRCPAGHPQDAR